jgi:hypothetical protein
MESDAFKRLLYKTIAEFLRKANVDVEHHFPWIARYTEDVGKDAPSQVPLYSAVEKKFKGKSISVAEIFRAHQAFDPQHDHLMRDIMTTKERRLATVPLLPAQIITRDDKEHGRQEFSQNLDTMFQQYDNPVVDPVEPWTPTQSSLNLSALRVAENALALSELKSSKQKRREQLLRELEAISEDDMSALAVSRDSQVGKTKPITTSVRPPPQVLSMGNGATTISVGLGNYTTKRRQLPRSPYEWTLRELETE